MPRTADRAATMDAVMVGAGLQYGGVFPGFTRDGDVAVFTATADTKTVRPRDRARAAFNFGRRLALGDKADAGLAEACLGPSAVTLVEPKPEVDRAASGPTTRTFAVYVQDNRSIKYLVEAGSPEEAMELVESSDDADEEFGGKSLEGSSWCVESVEEQ